MFFFSSTFCTKGSILVTKLLVIELLMKKTKLVGGNPSIVKLVKIVDELKEIDPGFAFIVVSVASQLVPVVLEVPVV